MGIKRSRRYTAEERIQAVKLAEEKGNGVAARELGLAEGTLSGWSWKARNGKLPGWEAAGSTVEVAAAETSVPSQESLIAAPRPPLVLVTATPTEKQTKRVAKRYTPSQRAQILEYAAEHGVSAASSESGASRWTIHDWQKKVARAAAGEVVESPVVGPDTDPRIERDRAILEVWKQHLGLGPSQIRNQLHRHKGMKISVNTVRNVMEENGYLPPKTKRRELGSDERYESVRPNHMWHMDFVHRFVHKQKVYALLIIDDFSRYIVGHALWDGEKAEVVLGTFEAAVSRYGKPEWAMSDRGTAFYSWKGISQFTRYLEDDLGCNQIIATRPQMNGKSEVLNANLQKEVFNIESFYDLSQTKRRLDAWVEFYNLRRTHHSLGGLLVPGDRYFGRADEVLRAIESGRRVEGVGEPLSPAERMLDLLKVTSAKGQVEVSLMGNRIWPPTT